MAVLPFVVQPKKNIEIIKIGDESSGVIEIKRKGYLSVAEKAFVDNIMQGSDGVASIVLLANKVSQQRKIPPEKAYMAITTCMSGGERGPLENTIAEEYGSDLAYITSKMAEAMQRRAICAATILLQTRVNHEWSIDDTLELHPTLVQQLNELYDREEREDPVEPPQKELTPEEEAAEVLGKSEEENGDN